MHSAYWGLAINGPNHRSELKGRQMAFRTKVDGGEAYKFEKVGQRLEGYYLGSKEFDGDYGPTLVHLFQRKDGVVNSIIGQGHLTRLLADEEPSKYMRVTYTGTKKGKKGHPMKVYQLEVDDTDLLDSSSLAQIHESLAASAAAEDEIVDDEVSDDEAPADEIKPARATAPARPATPPSAQRRNEVAALIKSTARR